MNIQQNCDNLSNYCVLQPFYSEYCYTSPLYKLLRINVKFEWNELSQKTLKDMKANVIVFHCFGNGCIPNVQPANDRSHTLPEVFRKVNRIIASCIKRLRQFFWALRKLFLHCDNFHTGKISVGNHRSASSPVGTPSFCLDSNIQLFSAIQRNMPVSTVCCETLFKSAINWLYGRA